MKKKEEIVVKNKGLISYPVGDFLIRVKNLARARKRDLVVRKTNLISQVANAMVKMGYLEDVVEKDGQISVSIVFRRKEAVFNDIKLISKPGTRVYIDTDELDDFKSPSVLIISTSKGIMSSKEAIKKRVGGEVIAEIS